MEKTIRIITHSGSFHADELLAVAALEIYLGEKPYEVIRTRDPQVIATGDYVVDVGGVYDPAINRFDHHQHGGADVRANGIPYSSFGLVWKHYGEKIAGSKEAAEAIDRQIGYPVDLGDNGIEHYTKVRPDTDPLLLHFVVAMFRPTWKSSESFDARFMELVVFFRRMLLLAITVEQDKILGKQMVEAAYQEAGDKRLIVLDKPYPWQEVLASHPECLYVVKPKSQNTHFEVEAVRDNVYGFTNRKNLPVEWAGMTGEKLREITGVPDAVFCHDKLYIAVAESKEGALALAELALAA